MIHRENDLDAVDLEKELRALEEGVAGEDSGSDISEAEAVVEEEHLLAAKRKVQKIPYFISLGLRPSYIRLQECSGPGRRKYGVYKNRKRRGALAEPMEKCYHGI